MFAYPNLQAMGMGTLGGLSMHSNMQMHQNASLAPPVPLPRYECVPHFPMLYLQTSKHSTNVFKI